MTKDIFLVFLSAGIDSLPEGEGKSLLRSAATYPLSDNTFLVQMEAGLRDVRSLIEFLGLSGENDDSVLGVVLTVRGTYGGFYGQSLWDWLREAKTHHVSV